MALNLPRRLWDLLNRFCADQGQCSANLSTWGQSEVTIRCAASCATVYDLEGHFLPRNAL